MDHKQRLRDAAHKYLGAGLCALPAVRDQKRPAVTSWAAFQTRLPTEAEHQGWFNNGTDGVCLVTGTVSGNLELIDFDQGGELFDVWCDLVPADLLAKLVIETSQSGGRHVVYRCEEPIDANQKLARGERDGEIKTLIETRGQGGLFLCAPTEGYHVAQGSFAGVSIISADDRDMLVAAARSLSEILPEPDVGTAQPDGQDGRPGDDFNERGEIESLLTRHGWVLDQPGENQHWRRPGKAHGTSATLRDRVFYVFSSNAAPFEPNRAYAPFSVYTLLEHGGDFAAAARALAADEYGDDAADDDVDLSGIVATDDTELGGGDHELADPGLLPEELLRVPGFISEVMDHTLATAPYPNLVMAFAGALALQAFLASRKVRDPGDNRTNLYLLALAHSAAGKDWPRKTNTRILHAVGLSDCLGERFASGEGIQDALFATPAMLFQTDEIDGLLQSINRSRDARHEQIMSTLLTLYSTAASVYPMRRKAGQPSPGAIDQPALSILGTAIPNHYYEALSERMLTNGFFARMIILEGGPRPPGQEPTIADVPGRVMDTASWWAQYQPGPGNLDTCHPVPAVVAQSPAARDVLIEARSEAEHQYAAAEKRSDPVGTTVWGRVSEQIRKLALVYAVSENHLEPLIDIEAVDWARQFVMHQTERMLFMASQHVPHNEFDATCKQLLRVLVDWTAKRGDVPMPEWELNRRLPWRPRDHEDVRLALESQRRIRFREITTKTKPRKLYWLGDSEA